MEIFDSPNVSVNSKTPEENLQALKSYLTNMSDALNYQFGIVNKEINALQEQINELKGDK